MNYPPIEVSGDIRPLQRPVLWLEAEQYDGVEALKAALEVSLRSVQHGGDVSLEAVLDKLQACLVIDGLEQLKAPDIDAIDDWITYLQTRLSNTQIIVTSQADLAQTRIDNYVRVVGVADDAGGQILAHYLRPNISIDASSLAELIAFADGHPLTLRLGAMLINHFGSSTITIEQIRRRGTNLLEVQKRSSQNRRTSLRTCLSLAYDALTDDERKLLYVAANAPGGLFSGMLEEKKDWISDGRSAIAALWKWGLIEGTDRGERRERIRMLSPIASYAITRWSEERPDEAKRLTVDLAENFALMAAVISMHSDKNGGIPNMVGRFKEEMPNLLRVLDLAERQFNDSQLGLMATGICAELMRYFFIIHLGHIGSQVMLRGARIALRDGRMRSASNLLTMTVGLAYRSQGHVDIAAAMALINEIGQNSCESGTLGNLALCRAIAGNLQNNDEVVHEQAQIAIKHFEEALSSASKSFEENIDLEGIQNDLSSSYGLLGGALLTRRDFAEAANAYRSSLDLVRGQSVAVNIGQLHHQLGNCEAYLGNLGEAALRYTEAATQFYTIGMRGYLGNALSEFGHLLLEFVSDNDWPTMPSNEIIKAGIEDVARTIEGCFGQYPFELGACSTALRSLFGIIVLISFSKAETALAFPKNLQTALLPWAEEAVYEMDEICMDELGGDAVHELKALFNLEAAIKRFEGVTHYARLTSIEIAPLVTACKSLGFFGGHPQRGRDWLMVYLRRHSGLSLDALNEFLAQLER